MQASTTREPKSQFEILEGTADEILPTLRQRESMLWTLVVQGADEQAARLKFDVLRKVATLIDQVADERSAQKWLALVEALTPEVQFSPNKIIEARMLATARTAILESGDFVKASEIAHAAHYSTKNPSSQPNRWKRNRQIFAVEYKGVDLYPLYALDRQDDLKPLPIVSEVLKLFTSKDSWQIAFWFGSLNSYLKDKMPKDLLLSEPQEVLKAAEFEALGLQHG
jgi:hypothetical protein